MAKTSGKSKKRGAHLDHMDPQDPASAGQSGDTQGLPDQPQAGPQSVTELIEEGQPFEAEVISGVENAPDADHGEIRTHERPEDDLPPEYRTPDLEKDV